MMLFLMRFTFRRKWPVSDFDKTFMWQMIFFNKHKSSTSSNGLSNVKTESVIKFGSPVEKSWSDSTALSSKHAQKLFFIRITEMRRTPVDKLISIDTASELHFQRGMNPTIPTLSQLEHSLVANILHRK